MLVSRPLYAVAWALHSSMSAISIGAKSPEFSVICDQGDVVRQLLEITGLIEFLWVKGLS